MLKTAKVVGLNSDTQAALAMVAKIEAQDKKIGLYAIVYCQADDVFSRIRVALADAEDAFKDSESSLSVRLSETKELIKQALKDSDYCQMLLATTQDDQSGTVLYLLCEGESLQAYLVRDGKSVDLCQMSGGQSVSGVIKPGDRVVFTTLDIMELFGGGVKSLDKFYVETLEDEVSSLLPEAQVCPMAAIVIEKEKPVEEKTEDFIESLLVDEDSPRKTLKFNLNIIRKVSKVIPRSKRGGMIIGVILLIIVIAGLVVNFKNKKSTNTPPPAIDNKVTLAQDLKIYPVNDFALWLDLDLIKKGFSTQTLSLSHGNVLALDPVSGVLIEVSLAAKSPQILAGGDKLGEAKLASLNGDAAWVFSKDKGIFKIEGKEASRAAIKSDDEWESIVDIYGFGGNIYLLDEFKNQIWKYLPVVAGYSDKKEYLSSGVKVDFAGAKRLQIDSSVWVLKNSGEILKFTQGNSDYFSISGLDKGIKEPKSFYVSDETDNLYLLDSGNNRLVVFDKKGVYQAQYTSDKFAEFTDLVVDEAGKKIYLLQGSKIYWMELK